MANLKSELTLTSFKDGNLDSTTTEKVRSCGEPLPRPTLKLFVPYPNYYVLKILVEYSVCHIDT